MLLQRLTARQIAEWEAYNEIDPIGEWRADYRTSYIAWMVTNLFIQAYGKKGAQGAKFEDFILMWGDNGKEEKTQSVEEMKAILTALASSQENSKEVKKRVRTIPKKSE